MKSSKITIVVFILMYVSSILFAVDTLPSEASYLSGTVVFCIKADYKNLINLDSSGKTGIASVDDKLAQLSVSNLQQRFKTNPRLYKTGMPDLTLIMEATYQKPYNPVAAAEILSGCREIEYAEPIPMDYIFATPNDPNFALSTYLTTMQASLAWDIHKGMNGTVPVIIANVDTGVNWKHPDLIDNIRRNLGEDADSDGSTLFYNGSAWVYDSGDINGIDDDGNGYIDDLIGWDFMLNAAGDQSYDPLESTSHGSYTAGISNARTDNAINGATLPWNVLTMPISCSYSGSSSIFRGYDGIIYAAENGADIINCSWGGTGWSQANEDAISYAYALGSIIVAAAGNSNNSIPIYPAGYPKVVAVTAVTNAGVKSASSNYSAYVDVSAPTEAVYSLGASLSGVTSYASPIGTGLAALIRSAHPTWTQEQVVNQLIATCDNIDASNPGKENMLGDGRLNAYSAMSMLSPTVDNDLRIALFEVLAPVDANANSAVEANEQFYLSMRVRNYAHGVSSANVSYTLSTTDASITILDNTHTGSLPSDGYDVLTNAFSCQVSPTATSHYATFTLTTTADLPIVLGSVQTFQILINAGGAFIWEGRAGRDYSGTYIKNWHITNAYAYTYGTTFPASFHSFSSVWLSFGAVGSSETRFSTMGMYNAVKNYLLEGGKIYIEGTDAVGFDLGYYLPDVEGALDANEVLWPLLGINAADDGITNVINGLTGQGPALTNGITFATSNQVKNDFIDTFTPADNAATAFVESAYGNVGIQNYGSHSQKSFVSSYILAELADGTAPNTKATLLSRIRTDFVTTGATMSMAVPNLSIARDGSNVNLSWVAIPYAASYKIEASDYPDSGFTTLTTTALTTWSGVSLPRKYYRVTSISNP